MRNALVVSARADVSERSRTPASAANAGIATASPSRSSTPIPTPQRAQRSVQRQEEARGGADFAAGVEGDGVALAVEHR